MFLPLILIHYVNGHEVIFDPTREFPAYSCEELVSVLPDVDAAIIGMDDYRDERVYQAGKKLKCVCKFGVGVDNIDLAMATRYGVAACNCPGQNSNAVAELTVGYMIGVLRHMIPLQKAMEKSTWTRMLGEELEGKTIGLIGFGAIARLVAEKLQNFQVKILAYDLYPNMEAAQKLGVTMTDPDRALEESDILSLHVPAVSDNYHMINKNTIAKMKDQVYIINAARGALIDLDDLAEAIQSGKVAGAALDAFETEPLPADSPILQCENVILAPHTGAETKEAYDKVSYTAALNVIDVLAGKKARYQCN